MTPRGLPIGVPVVIGLKPSDKSASELLARPDGGSKLDRAKTIIGEHLADGRPHLIEPIKKALTEAGMSESTGERAKRDLGVKTTADKSVPPVWSWTLPSPFIRQRDDDIHADEGTEGAEHNGVVEPKTAIANIARVPGPSSNDDEGTGAKGLRPRPGDGSNGDARQQQTEDT